MSKWDIKWAEWDSQELTELLADRWEPFAVTQAALHGFYVWLKKEVKDGQAG